MRGVDVRGDDVGAGNAASSSGRCRADVGDASRVRRTKRTASCSPAPTVIVDVLSSLRLVGTSGRQVQGADEALEAGRCAS